MIDLIITDINMPLLNGYALSEEIINLNRIYQHKIPMIFHSAYQFSLLEEIELK